MPIQAETALPGTPGWLGPDARNGKAEVSAAATAALPGDSVAIHDSRAPAAQYRVRVYRLGWYGGVVLWWGLKTPKATVAKLNELYQEQPVGVFGTPYATLGSKVAITAWTGDPSRYQQKGYYGQGHIAVCARYDDATAKAFKAFRDAYRGHGPEGIPLSSDEPGMGPQ